MWLTLAQFGNQFTGFAPPPTPIETKVASYLIGLIAAVVLLLVFSKGDPDREPHKARLYRRASTVAAVAALLVAVGFTLARLARTAMIRIEQSGAVTTDDLIVAFGSAIPMIMVCGVVAVLAYGIARPYWTPRPALAANST